jgi:hypothetical protein
MSWNKTAIKIVTSLPRKAYCKISVIAPHTLNSGAGRRCVVNMTLRPPYHWKLGGLQSPSGLYAEEQNFFPLPGI